MLSFLVGQFVIRFSNSWANPLDFTVCQLRRRRLDPELQIVRRRRLVKALPARLQGVRSQAREVLAWPKRSKLAHAFLWGYSDERLKLAQHLGQLGVFLTAVPSHSQKHRHRICQRNWYEVDER